MDRPQFASDEIADVSRRLYARRSEICLERQIGLTKLYNRVDDGAWRDLRDLHAELDEAVGPPTAGRARPPTTPTRRTAASSS